MLKSLAASDGRARYQFATDFWCGGIGPDRGGPARAVLRLSQLRAGAARTEAERLGASFALLRAVLVQPDARRLRARATVLGRLRHDGGARAGLGAGDDPGDRHCAIG